ncbi:PadR family transcriptional regulator [Streptomyces sp. SID4985]|uniref:PadR family transcriptional regulator n=1 Tax=unclassified Streptomyces TaxID=2593676 RepID=UPI00136F0D76|nr:PadR family transcriptional regulator [Streptomyces sp. SID4985]MYQ46565.1 PadR family transcriptional regulator [Streptomyces sp. SID4985]
MSSPVRSSPLALTVLALLHHKPLHPYGIQRLIKQWGKDQVVNVGQRAGLYRTIERLREAGLIAVRQTERDQQYPERTVYEITDAGRAVTRQWLERMLTVPRQEYPEFPAALSYVLMLTPPEARDVLRQRLDHVERNRAALEAALAAEAGRGLPRVSTLELDYLRTIAAAEEQWLRSVVRDLADGRLTWSDQTPAAFDEPEHGQP